jgi:hypothetical protein
MPRPCSVCHHGDRDQIDLELVGGDSFAVIAERHSVGADSLKRHKANHLTPAVIRLARQRRSEANAVPILDRLEEVVDRANRLLDAAESKGSLVAGAQLLGQLRMTLETVARLTGELTDAPQVQVLNVATSPDWLALRAAILGALAAHPSARAAVVEALRLVDPPALGAGS